MRKLLILAITALSVVSSAQTFEEKEMLSLVNQVRTNPKSFIPLVEDYIKSIEKGISYGIKYNRGINVIYEANNLIDFLNHANPIDSLIESDDLYPFTKNQALYSDSIKQCTHIDSHGELLSDKINSNKVLCGENCTYNASNAKYVLIEWLLDIGNKDKGHRANIFNTKFTKTAVGKVGDYWVEDFIN